MGVRLLGSRLEALIKCTVLKNGVEHRLQLCQSFSIRFKSKCAWPGRGSFQAGACCRHRKLFDSWKAKSEAKVEVQAGVSMFREGFQGSRSVASICIQYVIYSTVEQYQ